MKCPLCNTHNMKVAYAGPIRTGIQAEIWQCRGCNVQFYPAAMGLGDYQSGSYRDEVGHEYYGQTVDMIIPFREFSGKTVVDVGAGNGRYMSMVAEHGGNVIGIEPDRAELEILAAKFPMYDSLESAKDVRADFILCLTVIEHVESPLEFLRQMAGLLREGGKIILTTPNRESLLMQLLDFDYCQWFYRPAHRWYWDQASLAHTLNMAGLEPTMQLTYEPYGFSNLLHWMRHKKPAKGWTCGMDEAPMDFALRIWEMDKGSGHYLLNIVSKGKTQ